MLARDRRAWRHDSKTPTHGLGRRAAEVLRGVVIGHLRTGGPVGSEAVVRHGRLRVSPATVRVEMSNLTDVGMLAKPHASAGRIPTHAGFRVYVDHLMRLRAPSARERQGLVERLRDVSDEPGALVRQASRQLAGACTLAAIGRRPRVDEAEVERIELLHLGADRVMAVLLTNDGFVRNRVVRLEGVGQVELLRAQSLFNERFAERALATVRTELRAQIDDTEAGPSRRLLELAARVLPDDSLDDAVIVEGRTHLLNAGSDADQLSGVLQALEDKRLLLSLLDELDMTDGTQVVFGEETDVETLRDCTVVGAAFGVEGRALGTVAIVGPVRMNYARVVPWVGYTAEAISGLLRDGAAAAEA